MTIADLIQSLQQFDRNLPVEFRDNHEERYSLDCDIVEDQGIVTIYGFYRSE